MIAHARLLLRKLAGPDPNLALRAKIAEDTLEIERKHSKTIKDTAEIQVKQMGHIIALMILRENRSRMSFGKDEIERAANRKLRWSTRDDGGVLVEIEHAKP